MSLDCCPCCNGKAYYADLPVGDTRMWQVTCERCGLTTDLDEDKDYCRTRWNQRLEKAKLTMWITVLAILVPLLAIVAFLAGNLTGATL